MPESKRLSEKSATILGLIAEGHSYSQIVDGHTRVTYLDIFAAAEEALRLNESPSDYDERMRRIKSRYPRAYDRWDPTEDETLGTLHREGRTVPEIADQLQRQPSAIRSRLAKLNLVSAEQG
jgi:hypothetical protein